MQFRLQANTTESACLHESPVISFPVLPFMEANLNAIIYECAPPFYNNSRHYNCRSQTISLVVVCSCSRRLRIACNHNIIVIGCFHIRSINYVERSGAKTLRENSIKSKCGFSALARLQHTVKKELQPFQN